MENKQHGFPWGVYIGDLINDDESHPICLNSQQGGFCVIFDEVSQEIANNFIENIALKLFEVLPAEDICVNVFDFSHRKRFIHLSALQTEQLYDIAFNSNDATSKFNELEKIAIHRHHNILCFRNTSISQYNQKNEFTEKYYLLLINLNHYPDDIASYKRIKEFLDSAYDAGIYCIAFSTTSTLKSELKATQAILSQFPHVNIQNKKIILNEQVFRFTDMVQDYDFEYINDNKELVVENLLKKIKKGNHIAEQEFLSIPVGTSTDGHSTINFTLGDKTGNYHAFITGVAGSGKTTLLNNIILGVAKNYTAEEVRLYLMDYKEGVEFQVFKNHPNCEKIFLDNEDLQASVDLLEDFANTIKQRSDQFKSIGVKDINSYNQQKPHQTMERLVLIIDEVHRLFAGNYKQKEHFSNLLKQVVRQGRAFGVHIILSTQTLVGAQIDKELMSQIALRVSYKLTSPVDSEAIFTYGNTDAINLGKYEFIYNQDAGKREANIICRGNSPQDIKAVIDAVHLSRKSQLVLEPKIIKTETYTPVICSQSDKNKKRKLILPQFGTTKESKILSRLIQEGKIESPDGFIDISE